MSVDVFISASIGATLDNGLRHTIRESFDVYYLWKEHRNLVSKQETSEDRLQTYCDCLMVEYNHCKDKYIRNIWYDLTLWIRQHEGWNISCETY